MKYPVMAFLYYVSLKERTHFEIEILGIYSLDGRYVRMIHHLFRREGGNLLRNISLYLRQCPEIEEVFDK